MKDLHREILKRRIWEEVKQSDTNIRYAERLIDKHTKLMKIQSILVIFISGGGALLSLVDMLFPLIASAIVAVGSIAAQYLKSYDTEDMCKCHTECTIYLNHLQNLFSLVHLQQIDVEHATTQFTKLIEQSSALQTNVSKIFGVIDTKIEALAKKESAEYLRRVYFVD
jgi:hypothetical protein